MQSVFRKNWWSLIKKLIIFLQGFLNLNILNENTLMYRRSKNGKKLINVLKMEVLHEKHTKKCF